MQNKRFYRLTSIFAAFVIFQFVFVFGVRAQEETGNKPELSVVGIELGNRESAEKFLKNGYAPRIEEDGRVSYSFYNKWANQVMRLFAPSMEDKYFVTEIEVFKVGRSYRERHFHTEDIKFFETENGIFIGFKQSAAYFIAGIKNAGSINEFKPKHLIKINGEPDEKIEKESEKRETLIYKVSDIDLVESKADYEAEYEFYKNKLKRFRLKIEPDKTKLARN